MESRRIPFELLRESDLYLDAIYLSGNAGNAGDDPINKLIPCGNMGGFRKIGQGDQPIAVVLYSSLFDKDWPDELDVITGKFTYFGDNRSAGEDIHKTPRGGNKLLAAVFGKIHSSPPGRDIVPPFFIFTKSSENGMRAVQFCGLAVPGARGIPETNDLVAVWKSDRQKRYANYRATFTILKTHVIKRRWIQDLLSGNKFSENCPKEWERWV
jgi:hypothetical protein